MDNSETVGGSTVVQHPLISKQTEDVAKMRASLLAVTDDPKTAIASLQQVTVLRVFHQVSRIVRYLELMDKLEAKLYESLDYVIDSAQPNSIATMASLLSIQERLQRNMIESHRLLQPYIELDDTLALMNPVGRTSNTVNYQEQVLPKESREKLRVSAQSILNQLKNSGQVPQGEVKDAVVSNAEVVEGA